MLRQPSTASSSQHRKQKDNLNIRMEMSAFVSLTEQITFNSKSCKHVILLTTDNTFISNAPNLVTVQILLFVKVTIHYKCSKWPST